MATSNEKTLVAERDAHEQTRLSLDAAERALVAANRQLSRQGR